MPLNIHIFKKRDLASLAIAVSVIVGGLAIANNQTKTSPLHNSMSAYLVQKDQNGQEFLQAATEVAPGQMVEYELLYQNKGESALKDLVVTGPIPASTHYISSSAMTKADSRLQVSINGGSTFESEPVKRTFIDKQGRKVERIIPTSEYTHVRWVMKQPLHAGESQKFAYRSIVK